MVDLRQIYQSPLNPFPVYRAMRERTPIAMDSRGGVNVFPYQEVQRVLTEFATFPSGFGSDPNDPLSTSLISINPPRHRQMRSIVTQAFTPRVIALLEDRIRQIVDELLSQVAGRGKMDFVTEFTNPLPIIVIAELLGIPASDQEKFKHWSDLIIGNTTSSGIENRETTYQTAYMEMYTYFMQMLEKRRNEPKNDLISALTQAQVEGEHLSDMELMGFCILLLVAGNETTTNLIGNAMLCFDEHPEVMDELRANPTLIPGAIEEVLRYRSPVQCMFRSCAVDTKLGETTIKKGQWLTAWIGSANRDESQFPNAETFDIHRTPNRHIAFGHGIHFCIGAPLARLESRIALEELLARFQNIKRDRSRELEHIGSFIVFGVQNMPVTFEAR